MEKKEVLEFKLKNETDAVGKQLSLFHKLVSLSRYY